MRAYYKPSTQHKYCIYLTTEERAELLEECEGVDPDLTPKWAKVLAALTNPRDGSA
ncbi:hypothetical protein [Streptomyces sp. MH60]|uniref:hypothetical protein n=1 Tax=Streptomyces sp. MH60 TaxID=1940758 RepID=UPI000D49BC60|nr:hypothetical protein [Streptomyces sp. MH60]PPS86458.1 hypothetical protein BZZ08_03425 [Streptomyces sp. MH60]